MNTSGIFFNGGSVPRRSLVQVCADRACHRQENHWVGEYGCRWNDHAICNKDGTITIFKENGRDLPEIVTKYCWF